MFFTSDIFSKRIRESGKRKTVVDILSSVGTPLATNIPVASGSIKVDRNAAIRRSGSLLIPNRQLVPAIHNDPLLPYGTQIRIRQGIVYGDGTEELIPLGEFILDTTKWQEDTGPVPTIEFFDRAMVMRRAEIGPTLDYSGWLPTEAIINLMAYFWPELTVDFEFGLPNERLPGGSTFMSGNHWDVVQQLARRMGAEIYFNVIGQPVVRALPVFDDTVTEQDAVWDVSVGAQGILIGADRSVTRDNVYNSVYVVGGTLEGGVVPTGHAFNLDPNSPTFREGPFKKMGIRINDNTLTTDAQCQALAEQKLLEYRRLSQTLQFECVPNPAVDAGDIVRLQYTSGETQVGLVESFTLPIGPGSMSGECAVARL